MQLPLIRLILVMVCLVGRSCYTRETPLPLPPPHPYPLSSFPLPFLPSSIPHPIPPLPPFIYPISAPLFLLTPSVPLSTSSALYPAPLPFLLVPIGPLPLPLHARCYNSAIIVISNVGYVCRILYLLSLMMLMLH